ncbi:YbeD family protein [Marinicella gelatinilytica]|uniref:YbeD family protein n=1 Tax=Marinicella gelatinilytica TaxID=2996017 RepID=UPI002260DBE3|nr:DUF493 domain-containing protein [Marinicella gelatinilytica]MCX7545564.1 DUF493 domain-containing protein [Marinicella gelatinilytica]
MTDQTPDMNQAEGLTFPCEYPIKAMGANEDNFQEDVYQCIKQHAPEVSKEGVQIKTSKNDKYLSVTVLVYAQSREHLINIYQDLRELDSVVWTL